MQQAAASCASRSSRPRSQIEQAERQYDLNKAAELKYGKLPELEQQAARPTRSDSPTRARTNRLIKEEVTRRTSPRSSAAGPACRCRKLLEGEMQKLLHLGRRAAQARDRPGRGGDGGGRGGDPRAVRAEGPEPADRLVHLPGADRRRQNRTGPGAGRVPLRRREGHDPHRHVGVPGEAHGRPAGRRAARLHRLRGGRPADRGGAPPALLRDAVRRDREGAPRRLQRAAADARRRPADRRPGPHGGFQEHDRHHDVEHRQPAHPGVQGLATSARSTSA